MRITERAIIALYISLFELVKWNTNNAFEN